MKAMVSIIAVLCVHVSLFAAADEPAPGIHPAVPLEMRKLLARCAPSVLFDISTNPVAAKLDPELCAALAGFRSPDMETRERNASWLISAGIESFAAYMITNRSAFAWRDALDWMSGHAAEPASVGSLLACYDASVTYLQGDAYSGDADAFYGNLQTKSCHALARIYASQFQRDHGAFVGGGSTGVVLLAFVEYARSKWRDGYGPGRSRPREGWDQARDALHLFLSERATNASGHGDGRSEGSRSGPGLD